jgi:sporulation protein YlmC with PRC-barrel domain
MCPPCLRITAAFALFRAPGKGRGLTRERGHEALRGGARDFCGRSRYVAKAPRQSLNRCCRNQSLAATFSELTPDAVSQQQRRLVMLRTLALSASVIAFAGGLALAEAPMTREPSTGRSVVTSSLSTDHWLASDVYKADVYDPSEHKIGKVTDLMIDTNGNVAGAIIGVGGFLGVGEKDVVIPFKELKASTRDGKDWLVLNRTKDELKRAPAVNNTGSPSEYRGQGGDVR